MKIKTGEGSISLRQLLAIYSVSMVTSLPGLAISPILGELESIFHEATELRLQMLESLPSLIIVPFMLLAGRLSLNVNKKKLLITGLTIFFISSILYLFANSMHFLLWVSALLGIGAGMVVPFSTGLVADYFKGINRTRQLGYVSAINNFTLVLATLLSGFLAGINWHLSFIVYCISGISLFFAFYLNNKPPYENQPINASSDSSRKSVRPKWPIKLMLLYFFITLLALTVPLNLSLYIHNLNIGNYDISGTLISVFFLAITLPGIFIGKILKYFKTYTNFFSMILISAGLIFFAFKADLFLLILGVVSIGLGYGIMQPIIYDKTASKVPQAEATYLLALVMVMNYIAIIAYPFLLKLLQNMFKTHSAYFPFILSMFLSVAFTSFVFFRRHSQTLGTA